jgi:hypothetical protein
MDVNISNDSLGDGQLYDMVRLVMSKDYKSLTEWIVRYRYQGLQPGDITRFEENCLELAGTISPLIKKYRKLLKWSKFDEAYSVFKEECYPLIEGFEKVNRLFVDHLLALRAPVQDLLGIKEVGDESDLRKINDRIGTLENECLSPSIDDHYRDREDFMKRLSDPHLLLSELIAILTGEYNDRVCRTKKKIEIFKTSHEELMNTIVSNRAVLESEIEKIHNDHLLTEKDKDNLVNAFHIKMHAIDTLAAHEMQNADRLASVFEGIVEGFDQFKKLILALKDQLQYFEVRESYIDTLVRVEKKIPELGESIDAFYDVLKNDISRMGRSFVLCDDGLQEKILKTIEDGEAISKIVFSDPDKIKEELELYSFSGRQSEGESVNVTTTKVDLTRLETI